jgi:hypothetical protein
MSKEMEKLVLQNAREGKVVFMTIDGPVAADLDEFIKQPAEGILYDLNRDKATILSFMDDPKWVNDFAVAMVIEKLKSNNDSLIAELEQAFQTIQSQSTMQAKQFKELLDARAVIAACKARLELADRV